MQIFKTIIFHNVVIALHYPIIRKTFTKPRNINLFNFRYYHKVAEVLRWDHLFLPRPDEITIANDRLGKWVVRDGLFMPTILSATVCHNVEPRGGSRGHFITMFLTPGHTPQPSLSQFRTFERITAARNYTNLRYTLAVALVQSIYQMLRVNFRRDGRPL